MITSILDTDLYKLTMQQAIIQTYPKEIVSYEFINRGKTVFPVDFSKHLEAEITCMSKLKLEKDELEFLKENCPYFSQSYLEWLATYRYNPDEVKVSQNIKGELKIDIKGLWHRTVLWEVPLMAMISEFYFRMTRKRIDFLSCENEKTIDITIKKKSKDLNKIQFMEFGTRRRFSTHVQDCVVSSLKKHCPDSLLGTSNLQLAMKYGLKPIGTIAHEWFMFHGAFYCYKHANTQALASWQRVYNGKLSTMLTDTFSSDIFFKILSNKMANVVNQLDGFRHDSGDPFKYTDNVLRFLECSNIDPLSKKIVFSDSLTPEKAVEINNYCKDKINCSFGIGTNLSNDVGVKPLNIVIKMNNYLPNGKNDSKIPTVKLSDVAGKNTGTPEAIKQCKEELWI